jgi:hypothetical protein
MLTMRKSLQRLHCGVIGLTVLAGMSLGGVPGVLDGNVAQAQDQSVKHVNAVVRVDQGSGVIIKKEQHEKKFKYLIVTNEHVIRWVLAGPIEIQAIQKDGKLKKYTNAKVIDVAYKKCGLQKPPENGKQKNAVCYYDLALVELITDDTLQVAPISKDSPKVGDTVITMGYPALDSQKNKKFNKYVTGNKGEIKHVIFKDEQSLGGLTKIGSSASTFVGMSGGPVFNGKGEIVAINAKYTKGLDTDVYINPLTDKKPDPKTIKSYEEKTAGWAVGRAELCTWKPEFCKPTVKTTSPPPKTTSPATKPKNPQRNKSSIVEITVSSSNVSGNVSGVITKKIGNTYVVHTIMDKVWQGPFLLRVWSGTKMDTIHAKKTGSSRCDVRNKNCLFVLQFTSKLDFTVAEIGKSTVKVDWEVCMIDFKRAKENSPCTVNTVLETLTAEEDTFYIQATREYMKGGGIFYGGQLIGLIVDEETGKQISPT